MNANEARKYLIDISYALGDMSIEYLTEKDGDKMREAIKALEQEPVLDKIRAEIEETYMNITYEENHKVGGSWGLRKALEIIDKYKAESEEEL